MNGPINGQIDVCARSENITIELEERFLRRSVRQRKPKIPIAINRSGSAEDKIVIVAVMPQRALLCPPFVKSLRRPEIGMRGA
jgi:hypothetical protein